MKPAILLLALVGIASAQTSTLVTVKVCLGATNCVTTTVNLPPLVVSPPVALVSVACAPNPTVTGGSGVCIVRLSALAPSDLTLTIGAFPSGVTGPSSLTIKAGAISGQFTVGLTNVPVASLQPSVSNWTYRGDVSFPLPEMTQAFFSPIVWMGGVG